MSSLLTVPLREIWNFPLKKEFAIFLADWLIFHTFHKLPFPGMQFIKTPKNLENVDKFT